VAPCVGPTLGAASVLADLVQVALTMLFFGIGAAVPLILLGLVSKEALVHWRGKLMGAGVLGKRLLGTLLILVGLLIVTGLDKRSEALARRTFACVADKLDDAVLRRCGFAGCRMALPIRVHEVLGPHINRLAGADRRLFLLAGTTRCTCDGRVGLSLERLGKAQRPSDGH
jgi:hypothetical protein